MKKNKQTKPSPHKQLIEETIKNVDDEESLLKQLQNINIKLKFDKKDDVENWTPLLRKLETVLQKCRSNADDEVALQKNEHSLDVYIPSLKSTFHKELTLQILKFQRLILENCNKHSYKATENLQPLLQVDDNEVVAEALKTLEVFVRKPIQLNRRSNHDVVLSKSFQSTIFALTLGWGGKESNITLSSCFDDTNNGKSIPLHFDFYIDEELKSKITAGNSYPLLGQNILQIDHLESYKEEPIEMLKILVDRYSIPRKYHFPLYSRLRLIKGFPNPALRRQFIYIRLLGFILLANRGVLDDVSFINAFLKTEPDFLHELVDVLVSEADVPQEIRIVILTAFETLMTEGTWLPQVISVTGSSLHHGTIPTILRRAVLSLSLSRKDDIYSDDVTTALFSFIHTMMSTNAGTVALRSSGLIASLLPLLQISPSNLNEKQTKLVIKAMGTVELFLDFNDTAVDLFRELGGLDELAKRVVSQVDFIESITAGKEDIPESEKTDAFIIQLKLLKSLLLCTLACCVGRVPQFLEGSFPAALKTILSRSKKYGGSSWALVATITDTLIHNEPTCFILLHNSGIPEAFVRAVIAGVPPSSSAIGAVPSLIGALCLNNDALAKLQTIDFFNPLMKIFTLTEYINPLKKASGTLGAGIDELLRHHPSLKQAGVDSCIRMLQQVTSLSFDKKPSEEELLDLVHNVVRFFEALFGNSDHGQAFVDKKGHELLVKLLTLPGLPASFAQHSASRVLTVTFHGLSVNNIALVMKALLEALFTQFQTLDGLCNWKSAELMISMEGNNQVSSIVGSIRCCISVLASLIREGLYLSATSSSAAIAEWTSEKSIQVSTYLGVLLRVAIWEVGAESNRTRIEKINKQLADQNIELAEEQKKEFENAVSCHEALVNLMSSIHSLSRGIARSLGLPPRRREEKTIGTLLTAISKIFVDHFLWVPNEKYQPVDRAAYLANIIFQLQSIFFDNRKATAHTLLLHNFFYQGGVENLLQASKWLVEAYLEFDPVERQKLEEKEKDTTSTAVTDKEPKRTHFETALVNLGTFIKHLTNATYIHNAPVTANMVTAQNLPFQKGTFEPIAFIKLINGVLIKSLNTLWNHPALSKFPTQFISSMTVATRNIMDSNVSDPNAVKKKSQPIEKPVFTPDPGVVSQLMDMGFTKSHVEEALRHIGENNIPVATEWLLNNPEDISEESEEPAQEESDDAELAMALAMSLGVEAPGSKPAETTTATTTTTTTTSELEAPTSDEFSALKDSLMNISFGALIEGQKGLASNVADLLLKFIKEKPEDTERLLATIHAKLRDSLVDLKSNQKTVSYLLELLNFLASEDLKIRKIVSSNGTVGVLFELLNFAIHESSSTMVTEDQSSQPSETGIKWVEFAMSALDDLLELPYDTDKKDESKEKSEQPVTQPKELMPLLSFDDQQILLKICIGLLKTNLHTDVIHPLLLVCSRLTRSFEQATTFLQQGGVELLLKLKAAPEISLITIIIRHILEDPATLQAAMEADIITMCSRGFMQPKQFLITASAMVCRDPPTFLNATTTVCRIGTAGPSAAKSIVLAPTAHSNARGGNSQNTSNTAPTTSTTTTTSTDSPRKQKPRSPSNIKHVINILTNFIIEKQAEAKSQTKDKKDEETISALHIIQLLTELVSSYAACSSAILRHNFTGSIKNIASGSSNFIHFLLKETLPYAHTTTVEVIETRYNQATTKLLAALCSKLEGRKKVMQEVSSTLSQQISKSTRDARSSIIIHSIADLINLLLVTRNAGTLSVEMAKVMTEAKIPKTLVEASKALDLHHPDTSEIMTAVIKPLELLTRLATHVAVSKAKQTERHAPSSTATNEPTAQSEDIPIEDIVPSGPLAYSEDDLLELVSSSEDELEEGPDDNEENEEEDEDENRDEDAEEDEEDEDDEEEQEEEDEPASSMARRLLRLDDQEEDEEDEEEDEDQDNDAEEEEEAQEINAEDFLSGRFDQQNLWPQGQPVISRITIRGIPGQPNQNIVIDAPGALSGESPYQALLQSLPLLGGRGMEEGQNPEQSFAFSMSDILGRPARQVEQELQMLLGGRDSSSFGLPRSTGQRWSDDGGRPTQGMIQYAQSFEPILVEKLTAITEQEEKAKEAKKKEEEEAKKAEEKKQMEVEQEKPTEQTDVSMEAVPTTTETVQMPSQTAPSVTPPSQPSATNETQPTTSKPADTPQIDPTFLEALPEELRSEVLASQLATATPTAVPTNALNAEFLAALPPEIQREVLEQERQQQEIARREASQPADLSHAQEMDNASFIATLPPDLREEVLLSQDEAFIATLPPALAAEAHALREREMRRVFISGFPRLGARLPGLPPQLLPGASSTESSSMEMIDKRAKPPVDSEALPSLLRLLYLQQLTSRSLLQRTFTNLSNYESTRPLLLKSFLSILSAYLESPNPIQQLPSKSTLPELISGLELKTESTDFNPLNNPSHSLIGYIMSVIPYNVSGKVHSYPPHLVASRILEILAYLLKSNPAVADLLVQPLSGLESDKKEAMNIEASAFGSLLDILGAPGFYKNNNSNVDHMMASLSLIAKSLSMKLKKNKEKKDEENQPTTASESAPSNSGTSTTTTTTTTTSSTASTTSKPDEKKPTEQKEPEVLITKFTSAQLKNLVAVLTFLPNCSEATFKHFTTIVETLVAADSSNHDILLTELLKATERLSEGVAKALDDLIQNLESSHPSLALATLSRSIPIEINFLRILKSLVAIGKIEINGANQMDSLLSSLKLDPLWKRLEIALGHLNKLKITEMSGMIPVLSPLLPIIEAFFVTNSGSLRQQQKLTIDASTKSPQLSRFMKFAEQYKKLLNDLIKQNPSLLEDSFSVLLRIPQLVNFENKRAYFREQLQKSRVERHGEIRLNVRRSHIFEDSFYQLGPRRPEEMKGRLSIQFANEEGIDAGGVSREWYSVLAREMFNPNYCLFIPTADSAFQPNKNSGINREHLQYFKFIGRVIGKAIYDAHLLDAHFTRSFYKHILGLPIHYSDMEAIDPDYFKNLKWILENDITDVLELTFSLQTDDFGVRKDVELKPGGRNIPVTNENKEEYVRLVTEHKMANSIKSQIAAFLEGFHELIPPQLIGIFTPSEVELLISGLPDIDIDDLRINTEYKGYTIDSPIIQWFWQILGEFTQQEKALFLQFVTGTSKVPLEGFKGLIGMNGPQKFQIQKAYEKSRLPTAHTCFNQLDLPEYDSKEELARFLKIAIHEGSEGFAFG